MHRILLVLVTTLSVFIATTQTANAAPIWVERQFVPQPELLDSKFLTNNPDSTIAVDHSYWTEFLGKYLVTSQAGVNLVKYYDVSSEDRAALSLYISELAAIDVLSLEANEQLAYWINLYNALTVNLIITSEPLDSIRDLDEPWGTPVVIVNNTELTLNNIEHNIIRPVFKDNRIHYAVNCASIGCPNLAKRAYTGASVNEMLDASARSYVNNPRGIRVDGRRVRASKIYGWYREDFGEDEAAVLDHVRLYADEDLKAALSGKKSIRSYDYDWALNVIN